MADLLQDRTCCANDTLPCQWLVSTRDGRRDVRGALVVPCLWCEYSHLYARPDDMVARDSS